MQALLLAAGLGTRLRPLTNDRPKALVEVGGMTLLERNLLNLRSQGVVRVVVNVHHFAEQVEAFLASRSWGMEVIVSDERDQLLDTGGGLSKASRYFVDSMNIAVHNVDILSNVRLLDLETEMITTGADAVLAVCKRQTSRYLLFSSDGNLVGWHNSASGEYLWVNEAISDYKCLAFSGISLYNPYLVKQLPPADHPYPLIPALLNLAKNHTIKCLEHPCQGWLDVGKPETLAEANSFIARYL
ncbi:MAG: NTP transferase domain-containing protein [Bacteroidales bacterium]|nr:NTP transferase domain-containing protein [Bacteroidales bacterium]